MSAAQKTPISVLQEICSRQGLTPEYKLLSVEGQVHAPTFVYIAQVSNLTSTASGASKKKAKHSAAKSILEKILECEEGPWSQFKASLVESMVGMVDVTEPIKDGAKDALSHLVDDRSSTGGDEDDGIAGNPVGQLQELCMKQRWRPPFYETEYEQGLPHERTFGIMCIVNSFQEIGVGKSKKLAKRQAAYKMLKMIESLKAADMNGMSQGVDEELKAFQNLKLTQIPTVTPKYNQQVQQALAELRSAGDNQALRELHVANLEQTGPDYVACLQTIADHHKDFEVTYVPIELVSAGQFQCLVQLTSLPIAVCFGEGTKPEAAKQKAAQNALRYLPWWRSHVKM